MAKRGGGGGKDRTVSPRPEGGWQQKRDGASRAGSVHPTQKAAIDQAKKTMEKPGQGGELKVQGEDGRIRSKDTINRPDPIPPRDREH